MMNSRMDRGLRRGWMPPTPTGSRKARLCARLPLIAGIVMACAVGFVPADTYAQSAKSSLTDPVQANMFNDISDKLVCQCGCNMILRVCNHFECPSAIPMRAKIEEQILAGVSATAIIDGFVAEYGKVVLATPPPEGFNLAAWVMPGFMILLGLFVLTYITMDWLSKRKTRTATAPATVDPLMSVRIEDELKRLDG